MHTGKIKKLIGDRGFGFISDTDGRDVFFHQNSLIDVEFANLKEGSEVEFEIEKTAKGPRAVDVRVSQKAE